MSAERFIRSRHGSFVSMSNYDWCKEMQEFANQQSAAKDEQIKKLRAALNGMVNNPSQDSYVRAVEVLKETAP